MIAPPHQAATMRSYLISKPPSQLNPSWIDWSLGNFITLDPESEQVVALLYITRKREIGIIFKSIPVENQDRNFEGIIGHVLSNKSTPVFLKLNANEVGLCYAIQDYNKLPANCRPAIPLKANIF
jgi:hypothetical protein